MPPEINPEDNDEEDPLTYTVESCRLHSNEWRPLRRGLAEARCLLEDLESGETLGFRAVAHSGGDSSRPSQPSQPLAVPVVASPSGEQANPLLERRTANQVRKNN